MELSSLLLPRLLLCNYSYVHNNNIFILLYVTMVISLYGLSCISAPASVYGVYGAVTRPTIQWAVGFQVGNLRALKQLILHKCCGYELYYNNIYIGNFAQRPPWGLRFFYVVPWIFPSLKIRRPPPGLNSRHSGHEVGTLPLDVRRKSNSRHKYHSSFHWTYFCDFCSQEMDWNHTHAYMLKELDYLSCI
jgi:hypothetical protein